MFPFQSGELSFQFSTALDTNTFISTPNHLLQPPINNIDNSTPNLIKSPKSKKGRSKTTTPHTNDDINNEISGNDVAKKKISHREVERQRRQEMSNLHSSLRSLLPVEYVRISFRLLTILFVAEGKRSICDHVTEATKYIKELEKNVKELGDQRDKLKGILVSLPEQQQQQRPPPQPIVVANRDRDFGCSSSSSASTSTAAAAATTTSTSEYSVCIHKFSRTLQIEIAARSVVGDDDRPYPISKALQVLANEGVDVVSCVTSKVNQRWIFVIYCEINDVTSVDSNHLQEKLMTVVTNK